ncbi:MAG: hypothetical protein RSC60_05720, partial [Christensenellaceae bacterium]
DMWDSYLEKSGLTPEVLRMASDSLMEFMRNVSPAEPSSVHLPFRNQRSYNKRSDGTRNTAITSSSSLSPKDSVDSDIQNTPFNQDLSNEISTATSQVESLTQSESLSGESAGTDTHSPLENSNGGEGDKLNMRSPSASTNLERSKSSSPNTIINQKDGSVNSKTATLQGENQSTIQKTIDKSAVFVTPTSADAPPRKNPPIPTESDAPSAVAKTA